MRSLAISPMRWASVCRSIELPCRGAMARVYGCRRKCSNIGVARIWRTCRSTGAIRHPISRLCRVGGSPLSSGRPANCPSPDQSTAACHGHRPDDLRRGNPGAVGFCGGVAAQPEPEYGGDRRHARRRRLLHGNRHEPLFCDRPPDRRHAQLTGAFILSGARWCCASGCRSRPLSAWR